MTLPKVDPLPDGSCIARVEIPAVLWALSGEMAKDWEVPQLNALRIILKQVAIAVEETNGNVLGSMFKPAYLALIARDAAPVSSMPPIDVGKLARSTRTKSGFVGVYMNGKGFRAMAKMPDQGRVQKSIGTYPTAELAAWARYLHYTKHKMVYGDLEAILDDPNKNSFANYWRDAIRPILEREPTDLEVLAQVNEARADGGDEPYPVPEGIELPPPTIPLPRGRSGLYQEPASIVEARELRTQAK